MSNHFPLQEEIVSLLKTRTQSDNSHFFRLLVAYHFAQLGSMMRCNIESPTQGVIPVSAYVMNLAVSGFGKNHSLNVLEEQIFDGFKARFLDDTFPRIAKRNIALWASNKAASEEKEVEEYEAELLQTFEDLGELAFNFDSGTVPAIKQMRSKLLMAKAGSINFISDEVGSNLVGNTEVLTAYLELYDLGLIKQKLIKNTKDNVRIKELAGRTPTNALLFGTPDKLLDGGKIETEFDTMLLSGYARRLLFGYTTDSRKPENQTPDELFDLLTDKSVSTASLKLQRYMTALASEAHFGVQLSMSRPVSIQMLTYKQECEENSKAFGRHQEIQKAEMVHRYFKALKLAGAYAFVDKSPAITSEHLSYAIQLTEDSGLHFQKIQQREGSYVRLARYVAEVDREVTDVDLIENLPFYKGSKEARRQLMSLAIAWGHKNNVIIKRNIEDDIEFFKGESLDETDLDKLIISHSADITENFSNDHAPLAKLHSLTQLPNHNFMAHHLVNGYRHEDNCDQKTGFNLAIIDIDDGVKVHTVQDLLSDYTYHLYTTKRHSTETNRFRVILPLSHIVKLDPTDYSLFMESIFSWLPFECDTGTKDIARKWLTNKGSFHENSGKLLDATKFIPRTQKAERQQNYVIETQNMTALERWFSKQVGAGNRNNILLKYGLALLDQGQAVEPIRGNLYAFNAKLATPLSESEIDRTVMTTIIKRS